MIRADQIPKIKKFGLSCSIQPQFVESDAPWVIYILGLSLGRLVIWVDILTRLDLIFLKGAPRRCFQVKDALLGTLTNQHQGA